MSNPMSRRQWLKGFVAGLFGLRAALTPASAAASVPPVVPPAPSVPAHAGLAVCEGSPRITTFVYYAAPATDLAPCATSVYDAAGRLLSLAEPADPSGGKGGQFILWTKRKK